MKIPRRHLLSQKKLNFKINTEEESDSDDEFHRSNAFETIENKRHVELLNILHSM
jgi:hypothetical protein